MSDSQAKASRRWDAKNKDRVGYNRLKRTALSFVDPKPGSKAAEYIAANKEDYLEDLEELKRLIIGKED